MMVDAAIKAAGPLLAAGFGTVLALLLADADQLLFGVAMTLLACPPLSYAVKAWDARRRG